MVEEHSTSAPEPAVTTELRALVQRAQGGDAGALPRLREVLDQHPEVWQRLGDLSALAERAWIAVLAADHPLAVESMKRTVAEMRAELVDEHATRLERLLADQVAVVWLEAKCMENLSATAGDSSLEQSRFRLQRLESAQKRFESAVKTLTTQRSLLPSGRTPAQAIKLFEEPVRQQA
jgi:hypothetical protein